MALTQTGTGPGPCGAQIMDGIGIVTTTIRKANDSKRAADLKRKANVITFALHVL